MNNSFTREELAPGVGFSSVRDTKFKHNTITINLIVPLSKETAAGYALLPSLLRKGSRTCPDFTKLEQTLCDLYGAALSGDVTKYGEYQILSASITSIDDRYTLAGEEISGRCADLLGDMVLDPNIVNDAFPEEDFRLEQQYLIDTIEAEINEKRGYALRKCRDAMCEGTRLAVPKYGTVADARALTPALAAAHYRRLIDTARVEILFTGCGDPQSAREKFRERFAALERHPAGFEPRPIVERAGEVRSLEERMEIAQSKLVLGMRPGDVSSRDKQDAMRMMTALYGGTPFARLFVNVREKLSLCYYCAARFDQATGILLVDIGVEKENREKAQKAILRELDAIAKGEFTDEELASTKLAYANSLKSVGDSLAATESWYLTQILRGRGESPEQELAAMDKVGRAQVEQAAAGVTLDTVYFLTSKEAKADA